MKDSGPIISRHPILGEIRPDHASNIFGMGFQQFNAARFEGLCRFTTADTIDILAIISKTPRCGHLAGFINGLKKAYRCIRVYEIMNPHLLEALTLAHGFTPFDEFSVTGPNLQWERK